MGKRFFVVFGLFLIAPMLFAQNEPLAKISYLEGVVTLNLNPAQIDMAISEGDELSTQKGRVEVFLQNGYLWLNRHTQVVFASEGLGVRYGEIYVETEVPIEVKTPHERFSVEGSNRIEVDRFKTRKFQNPMLEDDFDKWVDRREKELAQIAEEEQLRYPEYREYRDYSWTWYPFGYYWTWYPYYWYSWYWTGWYGFGWYYPYYGYYYPYRDYYWDDQPRYGSALTTIRKSQLQKRTQERRAPEVSRKQLQKSTDRVTTESSRLTKKSVSRSSMKTYPSRISNSGLRSATRQSLSKSSSNDIRSYRSRSSTLSRSSSRRSRSPTLSRSPSRSYSSRSIISSRSSSRSSFSRSSASRSSSSSSRGSSGSSRGSIRRK